MAEGGVGPDFHFTEHFVEAWERHSPEFADVITDMLRKVLAGPNKYPFALRNRKLRMIRHRNPLLLIVFTVSRHDGSVVFEDLLGPKSP